MDIEVLRRDALCIVRVNEDTFGETDLAGLGRTVRGLVDEGATGIVLVFRPTCYPYSSVIASLVEYRQMVEKKGGVLTVVQPNEDFQYVLESMSLGDGVKIVSSEEHAG
ncbi:MAG: hypothetical protein GF418_05260 [Chitinivibrionales bacterium]|nr:hypothetical protein [Chitinivibrionales bacterium]MBD3395019.1 hypothetical protein [Chitinivibrionales bacterium]